ncbi:MAG TPA: hypothetical protein VJQ26_10765, partial [Ktedonobacteraceae bacterium]|nr:hypothetical protein [Ktedonobacteraceae bacterium]
LGTQLFDRTGLAEPKVVPGATSQQPVTSYLSMRTTFSTTFADAAYDGFDRLLAWQPIEAGYISGDLLIVPFAEKSFLFISNELNVLNMLLSYKG